MAQFSSVAQSCPTLCDPVDCSMPGLPVYHELPELAQTHVHQVGDAMAIRDNFSSSGEVAVGVGGTSDGTLIGAFASFVLSTL